MVRTSRLSAVAIAFGFLLLLFVAIVCPAQTIFPGNVGIGTTSPGQMLDVNGNIHSSGSVMSDATFPLIINTTGFAYIPANTSHVAFYKQSGSYLFYWRRSDNGYPGGPNETQLMQLDNSGNLDVNGNFYASSDARIKTNVRPLSGMLAAVKQLNPVSYARLDTSDGETQVGFLAQEVQPLFPNLVINTKHVTDLTPDGMLSVNYNGLVPALVKAVQELSAANDALTARLAALEKKVH